MNNYMEPNSSNAMMIWCNYYMLKTKYLSYSNIYPKCLYVKKIHLAHIPIFF
jgi:hypothetical protein